MQQLIDTSRYYEERTEELSKTLLGTQRCLGRVVFQTGEMDRWDMDVYYGYLGLNRRLLWASFFDRFS